MLSYLWFAIFGLIVGALAKLVMPGKDPGGIIVTSLLGVAGSVVGGAIGGMLGMSSGAPAGWIGSFLGAILLLWIYRSIASRT